MKGPQDLAQQQQLQQPQRTWWKRQTHAVLMAGLTAVSIACGTYAGNPGQDKDSGGGGTGPGTGGKFMGAVRFAITDAPVDDAKHVFVTLGKIEIQAKDSESWIEVPLKTTEELDLLALQDGKSSVFAALDNLAPGEYGQTRLVLANKENAARLVLSDGTSHELKIPSGAESGLKINTSFTVVAGQETQLVIDFDLRKSLQAVGGGQGNGNGKNAKYHLKPQLRLVDQAAAGSLEGNLAGVVPGAHVVCVYKEGTAKDATAECAGAVSSAKVKAGRFVAGHLNAGRYEVRVFATDGTPSDPFGVVEVVKGETTKL